MIDEIIIEPLGGAHRDPQTMAQTIKASVTKYLKELSAIVPDKLIEARYEKYRKIGAFSAE